MTRSVSFCLPYAYASGRYHWGLAPVTVRTRRALRLAA